MIYEKKPARSLLEEQIRLTGLRKSAVAEKLNVSLNTLGRWISKKHPIPDDKLNQFVGICSAHGVKTSVAEIRKADGYPPPVGRPPISPKEDRQPSTEFEVPEGAGFPIWTRAELAVIAASAPMMRVPVLGRTPLGALWESEENFEGVEEIPEGAFRKKGRYFALRGRGDSMNLAGICDGDTVILREIGMQEMARGSIVLVDVHPDGSTIKRMEVELRQDGEGYEVVLHPMSSNPSHAAKHLADVLPSAMGVVVAVIKEVAPKKSRK